MSWKGMTFELPDKSYETPEYVMNLISHKKSIILQSFRDAFEYRQSQLGDKSTYDGQKHTEKAIEILEEQFNYDKQKVAIVMKYIIENKPEKSKTCKEFKNTYEGKYAQYILKKFS